MLSIFPIYFSPLFLSGKSQRTRRDRKPGHTSGREHAGPELSQLKPSHLTGWGVRLPVVHWHTLTGESTSFLLSAPRKTCMPFFSHMPMNTKLVWFKLHSHLLPQMVFEMLGPWSPSTSVVQSVRFHLLMSISVNLPLEAILSFEQKKPTLWPASIPCFICTDSDRPGS